jgi:hypothetical protein
VALTAVLLNIAKRMRTEKTTGLRAAARRGSGVTILRTLFFQYSVSHHNKAGRIYDGGGFDIDGGSQNCIIQYCYSYDNDGAGMLFLKMVLPTSLTTTSSATTFHKTMAGLMRMERL